MTKQPQLHDVVAGTLPLTPPLAALRNLLLFSISEEFTTFQHIRPGVGWGWGGMLTFICTCTPRGCYVAATWGMGWGGVEC